LIKRTPIVEITPVRIKVRDIGATEINQLKNAICGMPNISIIVGNNEYTPFRTRFGIASTNTREVRTFASWRNIPKTKNTTIINITGASESIGTLSRRMSVPGMMYSIMGEPGGGTGKTNMIIAKTQKNNAPQV